MPIRFNRNTGRYEQFGYGAEGARTDAVQPSQMSLMDKWKRGQTRSDNLYGTSVGAGNRRYGGTSYISIGGVQMPIFGSLAGKARQSVGWNQGRQSMSDFFGLGRSQPSGQYSSSNAMKQRMQQIMAKAPDKFKRNEIINPRDRLAFQKAQVQSKIKQLQKAPVVGRERVSGGNSQMVQQSSGQQIQDLYKQQKQIGSRAARYRGHGGMRKARREAYNPYEKLQQQALKGYTPTTANLRIKETLKSPLDNVKL